MLAVIETSDYIIAEAFLTLHLARTLLSTVSLVLIYGTIAQLSNSSLNVRPLRKKAVPSGILVTNVYIYYFRA